MQLGLLPKVARAQSRKESSAPETDPCNNSFVFSSIILHSFWTKPGQTPGQRAGQSLDKPWTKPLLRVPVSQAIFSLSHPNLLKRKPVLWPAPFGLGNQHRVANSSFSGLLGAPRMRITGPRLPVGRKALDSSCYHSPFMPQELSKSYEPAAIELKWAKRWVEQGLFQADARSSKPMFSIVIPPPNVTGSLHMGHMLEHTQIDALVRWKRMQGFNTLWLPGTDHAGIGTQVMVERQLAAEGLTRQQIGREEFERRVWKWKEESGDTIKKQMTRLGASCDWSRERFTLDPGLSRAVREVFVSLYEKGLIYRGTYIIQWCPRCQTALSDLEVVHEERQGHLWYIRYPLLDLPGEYLVVATTRPETMLGDTAVAVHPKDERYARYHGRRVLLPLMNREIPVIVDELAKPEFATGVVKVTPAHDPNDYEVGLRHNLPQIEVIDATGQMSREAGPYRGLDRLEARKSIVSDLEHLGLMEKVEPYTLPLGCCYRCGTAVEPRVSTQWFVRVKPLAERAAEVVRDGRIRIVPENHSREYLRWMENIHDWCISRQLWWGHRIPAWYCSDCGEMTVAREDPSACACDSRNFQQDEDVLDTWFSSALWPFSTMGWPEKTEDLRVFYPTSLLITGFDILFFWVARMVMMGMEFMNEAPFREVYIHALVRTAERQKMSKTKGNVIDPLEVTEKYGTDAVRFTLAILSSPGTDIALSESRMESYRAFANKIWNAARLIFLKAEGVEVKAAPFRPLPESDGRTALEDRWMASRLNRVAGQLNASLEQYRFHEAAHILYHFFWHEFCDWYIELAKLRNTPSAWRNLAAAFENALRLLHPFMPFLTEELWQRVTGTQESAGLSIALEPFPTTDPALLDGEAERRMAALQEAIVSIRNARVEMKVEPRQKIAVEFYSAEEELRALAEQYRPAFERLAQTELRALPPPPPRQGGLVRHPESGDFDLRIPYAGVVDVEAERQRLEKERQRLLREYAALDSQLNNPTFRARAPGPVVAGAEQRLRENQIQQRKIEETLSCLGA